MTIYNLLMIIHRLRNKKDEEDSDAEDEELPLTAEEQAQQQEQLDKHAEACDKVNRAEQVCQHAVHPCWQSEDDI